jgi:hypothetical protein
MPARDIKKCVLLVSEWVARARLAAGIRLVRPPSRGRNVRNVAPKLCVVAAELLNPTLDAKYEKRNKKLFLRNEILHRRPGSEKSATEKFEAKMEFKTEQLKAVGHQLCKKRFATKFL